MLRILCAACVVLFSACTTPPSYVRTTAKPRPMTIALAPVDTPVVRQLCVAPDSVVAERKPCVLRGQ